MDNVRCCQCLQLLLLLAVSTLGLPLPSFKELTNNYPGYAHHGGTYKDMDILRLFNTASHAVNSKDTSALRLSIALNKASGQHRLGSQGITITKAGGDSIIGRDNLQYIHRTLAFGPFLAMKYESPELYYPSAIDDKRSIENSLTGRQGIVRVITYKGHDKSFDGRILLWDCNRFYQARNYLQMHHVVAIEFWQLPDSQCK